MSSENTTEGEKVVKVNHSGTGEIDGWVNLATTTREAYDLKPSLDRLETNGYYFYPGDEKEHVLIFLEGAGGSKTLKVSSPEGTPFDDAPTFTIDAQNLTFWIGTVKFDIHGIGKGVIETLATDSGYPFQRTWVYMPMSNEGRRKVEEKRRIARKLEEAAKSVCTEDELLAACIAVDMNRSHVTDLIHHWNMKNLLGRSTFRGQLPYWIADKIRKAEGEMPTLIMYLPETRDTVIEEAFVDWLIKLEIPLGERLKNRLGIRVGKANTPSDYYVGETEVDWLTNGAVLAKAKCIKLGNLWVAYGGDGAGGFGMKEFEYPAVHGEQIQCAHCGLWCGIAGIVGHSHIGCDECAFDFPYTVSKSGAYDRYSHLVEAAIIATAMKPKLNSKDRRRAQRRCMNLHGDKRRR